MRCTRSLGMVAIGLALTWSAARGQGPAGYWPGTSVGPGAPVQQAGCPTCAPAGMPGPAWPGGAPLPAQPAEAPMAPGMPQGTAPIHPATMFPTGEYHDINGLTEGGNSFSCQTETDNHPCIIAHLEYLGWWPRRFHTPLLVTTGPSTAAVPGVIGGAGTAPVFGPQLSPGEANGGRATVEYLFPNCIDPCTGCYCFGHSEYLSVEASGFGLANLDRRLDVASSPQGFPALSRPFFNTATHMQDVDPISSPTALAGGAEVAFDTKMYGGEANVKVTQYPACGTGSRVGVLAGARYLSLDQGLRIDTFSHDIGPGPAAGVGLGGAGGGVGLGGVGLGGAGTAGTGTTTFVTDQFSTHNRFYGGQVGVDVKFYWWDRIDLDVIAKVALGQIDESLRVNGASRVTGPGGFSNNTGLFAQANNVGRYSRNEFTEVPELTVTLGFRVWDGLRVYAGYNYLFIDDVLQPGQVINTNVSVPALAAHGGAVRLGGTGGGPVNLTSTEFWVQGVVAGVEVSY